MFSLVALKAAALDAGTPGISPWHAMLLLLMILFIPMIPYIVLSHSLQVEEEKKEATIAPPSAPEPFVIMIAWMHEKDACTLASAPALGHH